MSGWRKLAAAVITAAAVTLAVLGRFWHPLESFIAAEQWPLGLGTGLLFGCSVRGRRKHDRA